MKKFKTFSELAVFGLFKVEDNWFTELEAAKCIGEQVGKLFCEV